jgi:hypothetical protein
MHTIGYAYRKAAMHVLILQIDSAIMTSKPQASHNNEHQPRVLIDGLEVSKRFTLKVSRRVIRESGEMV